MSVMNIRYPHIRDLREDADLTQTQMAEVLNCTQGTYSHYEVGQRDIPTEVLIKIADYHNCSVDYLLGRTNNPSINR